jgi:hypothetical protein
MKVRWLRNNVTIVAFFSGFRWFRKLAGGKWECWWVEGVDSHVWHDVKHFTREWNEGSDRLNYRPPLDSDITKLNHYYWGFRPSPLCRGTPIEEDWDHV